MNAPKEQPRDNDTSPTERVACAVLDDLKWWFAESMQTCNGTDYTYAMREARKSLKRSVVLRRFLRHALDGLSYE